MARIGRLAGGNRETGLVAGRHACGASCFFCTEHAFVRHSYLCARPVAKHILQHPLWRRRATTAGVRRRGPGESAAGAMAGVGCERIAAPEFDPVVLTSRNGSLDHLERKPGEFGSAAGVDAPGSRVPEGELPAWR